MNLTISATRLATTCIVATVLMLPVVTRADEPAVANGAEPVVPVFGFITMNVVDLDRMLEFYTVAFGMAEQFRMMEPHTEVGVDFPTNNAMGPHLVLAHANEAGVRRGIGAIERFSLYVTDVAATCRSVKRAGGKILQEPYDISEHKTKVAFVSDPEGNTIELLEVYR